MDSSWLCLDVEVNLRGARRSVSLFFLHVARLIVFLITPRWLTCSCVELFVANKVGS